LFLTFVLSGMGGHTSSYATAGIILKTTGTHKPPHPAKCYVKVEISARGHRRQQNKLLATEMDYWRRSARKSRTERIRNTVIR
jgi:hypothetical protein